MEDLDVLQMEMESLFRTELRVNEVLVAVETYTFHHFHDGE